jgi:CRISPR system Cascade subunit CasA
MPFQLIEEPWIPCRRSDGTRAVLGLRELLASAPGLDAIDHPSPLVTLAISRMVLALIHRVFGPPDFSAWREIYDAGRFPEAPLDAYFRQWESRFDLLHPEFPFYQTRGLTKKYEPDGVSKLIFERTKYAAESAVFEHRPSDFEANDEIPFGEAACHLVALQAFTAGGLIKKKDEPDSASAGPMNRGAFVMIHGDSLFETLLFNLMIYDPENNRPIAGNATKDLPAWERPPLATPGPGKEPKRSVAGYIDWLTWQSRRVELVLNGAGTAVSGLVYCVGQGLGEDPIEDPMLAFRIDKARGPVALDLSEDRAVWRDCNAFVRTTNKDVGGGHAPALIGQYQRKELRAARRGRPVRLTVMGLRGDQAKLKLSRMEELRLPDAILEQEELRAAVAAASEYVEKVGKELRTAMFIAASHALAPGDREALKEDAGKLVESAGVERHYWGRLGTAFDRFLFSLPNDSTAAMTTFQQAADAAARTSLNVGCVGLGGQARHLKGQALGEAYLGHKLGDLKEKEAEV